MLDFLESCSGFVDTRSPFAFLHCKRVSNTSSTNLLIDLNFQGIKQGHLWTIYICKCSCDRSKNSPIIMCLLHLKLSQDVWCGEENVKLCGVIYDICKYRHWAPFNVIFYLFYFLELNLFWKSKYFWLFLHHFLSYWKQLILKLKCIS